MILKNNLDIIIKNENCRLLNDAKKLKIIFIITYFCMLNIKKNKNNKINLIQI